MCGNAIRCVAKYVYDRGLTDKKRLVIETLSGPKTLNLEILNGKVCRVTVNMGGLSWNRPEFRCAGRQST